MAQNGSNPVPAAGALLLPRRQSARILWTLRGSAIKNGNLPLSTGNIMLFIDQNHPLYRPLWVRLLIVGLCFGWAAVEFATGGPFWGVLVGGIGCYAGWVLLLNFHPRPLDAPETIVAPADPEENARD
jgi:hypothetical protein